MRQTVVATFERYAAARHAAQQLRDSGFGDSVFVTDEINDAADEPKPSKQRDEGGVFAHVRQFFSGLFAGDADAETRMYAEALRRGGAIVKVEVDAEADVEKACQALEAAGAIDIDERAGQWRASGWKEGTSLMSEEPSSRVDSGGSTAEDNQATAGKEELEAGQRAFRKGGVRVYQWSVEPPMQETTELRSQLIDVQSREVERPEAATDDSASGTGGRTEDVRPGTGDASGSDFRSHFDANFAPGGAQWEDYEPAYRYGDEARSDNRYSGRHWDEVQHQLRGEWETRDAGPWDRFKAAIRHAWDRVTS